VVAWLTACLLALALEGRGLAAGAWTPLVRTAPGSIGLMMLLSDGTVLAMDSSTSAACYRLTPDSTGSYVNGTWTTLGSMNSTRLYYSSQVLKDGRVFVAGGEYGTGNTLGETYNPLTNAWTAAPVPGHTFSDSNSEILPDGRVLCALVEGSSKGTILFDPTASGGVGSWTLGPSCLGSHNESAWVKLPDNSILFVDKGTRNSERYIPALNQWVADGTVPVDLFDPYGAEHGAGLLLPNGKAFFLGSPGHTAIYTPSGTTAAGTWIAGPDIPNASGTPDAPAAMMVNGKILCAVSPIPTSGTHFPTPTTFYEYDYGAGATGTFTQVSTPTGGTINHASYYGSMLTLPNGTVLYADFHSQIYSYAPDGTPLAAGKPVISSITANGNGSYHLTGTQLNGISEGSAYGDDNQNATNYPIVRLTSGSNVYYARTFNWSSTGVQTGNTPVTTEFTVPGSVPTGIYPLVVVANGIASDPVSFTNGILSTNANLSNLVPGTGTLTPGFAGATTDYTVTVPNATASITFTPTVADSTATVKVNNTTVASGSPSGPITLVVGPNPIPVVVTAQDTTTTKTYTVTVTRIANVNCVFNAPTEVPVTAGSFTAAGKAVFFTLNCAPAVGANLTVVNSTGLDFIGGRFENLAQGQAVALTFNGATYKYVANYHGGTGNDLVLVWAGGRPLAWGAGGTGQLGNNGTATSNVPVAAIASGVLANRTVIAMAAGQDHTLALCADGTLAAWGSNSFGQLGNNSAVDSNVPVAVVTSGALANRTVVAIAAGQIHSMALCSDGTIATWGYNNNGELGNSGTASSSVPVAVSIAATPLATRSVVGVAAGAHHSLARCSDGTVAAWGLNNAGQLGDGSTVSRSVPVAVSIGGTPLATRSVTALAAGFYHTLAACSDGTVAAWGANANAQLGNGSFADSNVPVAVNTAGTPLAGRSVKALAAGSYCSMALCSDGVLTAWGANGNGQLGDGTIVQRAVPVAVQTSGTPLAGNAVSAIAAGAAHGLALCADGTLAAWGYNGTGALGNGSTTDSNVPMAVSTASLTAGERFVLAGSGQSANHSLAFVATPPPAPVATTLAATSITITGATLNGTVNPNGNAAAASFDFGTGLAYGANFAATPASVTGTSATPVSVTVSGLHAGITYHFRARGTTVFGAGSGGDLTFTTLPETVQDWRLQWYGAPSNTGNAADSADPYQTGIPNLAVFALLGPDQNPALAVAVQLPQPQIVGPNFVLSFTEPAGVSGVTYGAEWRAALDTGTWQPVTDSPVGTVHTFSVPIGGNGQIFMRLRVSTP
jgi:alpha-tubulin suppressor-like RCC1 family protein